MATPKVYQCEFLDTVPDICQCKKCSLVARRLTVTSCCGESFCHACISEPKEQNKPCPECGEEEFTFFNHVKFQRQINKLQVFCSLKISGCGWSGPLEQLEAHLDPDQDHCQYVDTKCPLNCQQTIPKNKVEQHVAEECVRRDFTCQHCNFKATYEEVVGTHLAECSYVPLQCPNRCGVTCERGVMEDHMRICRLEEVECEFSGVGCEERPRREDQEEHTRQNTQKHITLTATATMKTREIVQQRLGEQVRLTQKKLQDQEQGFQASTTKTRDIVQQRLDEQERLTQKKLQDQEQRLLETLLEQLEEKEKKIQQLSNDLSRFMTTQKKTEEDFQKQIQDARRIPMRNLNFKIENLKNLLSKSSWTSPPMITHGYRFVVELDFSRNFRSGERGITVDFKAIQGYLDHELEWPVHMKFNYEVLNNYGDTLFVSIWTGRLYKFASRPRRIDCSKFCPDDSIPVSKVLPKLHDCTLYFNIVNALIV